MTARQSDDSRAVDAESTTGAGHVDTESTMGAGNADTEGVPIAVSDLSVSFGDVDVLSNVDLSVAAGTFVGLVGPNGAGKTTLLRTIRGTLDPDRGTVRVDGESIHDLSARRASRLVASVPQSTTLSFDFTVEQIVEMGRTPHLRRFGSLDDHDRQAIETAMDRTQVRQFADRAITDVSGGERQRVLLARALAQDAPALVLDEPTANLDVNHAVRTLELVEGLVADGKTVVAAIHDLNLAARYCDEIVLLADGAIRAAGAPSDVLTETAIEQTFGGRALVTTQPATDAPLVTALGDYDRAATRVHVVGTGRQAATTVSQLVAAGLEVSVGVVPAGDAAAERARDLDCRAVTVPAFAGIDRESRVDAVELATAADAVVVASDVDAGNRAVVDAATRLFVVESPDGSADVGRLAGPAARRVDLADLPETIAAVVHDS